MELRKNIVQRRMAALENHLKQVPEDARARILLGGDYADMGREEDALRETGLAITLRANEASILYNAACNYCGLKRKAEALDALRKAWDGGFKDATWARRDPDLALLHDDPEFRADVSGELRLECRSKRDPGSNSEPGSPYPARNLHAIPVWGTARKPAPSNRSVAPSEIYLDDHCCQMWLKRSGAPSFEV